MVQLSVRVPAALAISHALDTLSVTVDPASLGLTQVAAHRGTVLGVEVHVLVFPRQEARGQPVVERRAIGAGADFGVGSSMWSTARDGVPSRQTRYVVEMQLVLFETDVALATPWDPHAGTFAPLWTRTLRQAEE